MEGQYLRDVYDENKSTGIFLLDPKNNEIKVIKSQYPSLIKTLHLFKMSSEDTRPNIYSLKYFKSALFDKTLTILLKHFSVQGYYRLIT